MFICKPRPAATLGLQILGVNTHPWMRCGLGGVGRILPTPPPPTFPVPRYRSSDHPNTTSPAINNCRSRAHPPNIYTFAYSMPPIEYPILDTVQRILPNRTTDNQKRSRSVQNSDRENLDAEVRGVLSSTKHWETLGNIEPATNQTQA